MKQDLRSLQKWMVSAITGADADAEQPERYVTGSSRLGAAERFDVYRAGYRARLVECIADDYPILYRTLGEARFEALCRAYIDRHPSASPNLNYFSRHMAAFCKEASISDFDDVRAFASELAALEWALVEAIHEDAAPPLDVEAFKALPPEAWGSALLVRSASARLLRFTYPVNAFYQACRNDDGAEVAIPSPSPSALVVYRHGLSIWRMDLSPAMTTVLAPLFDGKTIGAALEEVEASADPAALEEIGRNLSQWFRDWVEVGLFARVEIVRS